MDIILCDELVQEILERLPPSSAPSVSLVSKRWLSLLRSCTTSLSIRIPSSHANSPLPSSSSSTSSSTTTTTTTPSLSSILSHYPYLSNLTILGDTVIADDHLPHHAPESLSSSDTLLLTVAAAACSRRLAHLRFFPNSPVSPLTLLSSASSFTRLTNLQITSLLPLSFRWLASFPSLRSLSLVQTRDKQPCYHPAADDDDVEDEGDRIHAALPLESLSLSGIRAADRGLSWLWRRSANLRWLQLRACEGTGDSPSSPSFPPLPPWPPRPRAPHLPHHRRLGPPPCRRSLPVPLLPPPLRWWQPRRAAPLHRPPWGCPPHPRPPPSPRPPQ